MTRFQNMAAAALAAWLCAGCAATPGTTAAGLRAGAPDPALALAQRFDSLRQARGIPGLAAVILRDTTIVLARGFGYADLGRGVPVTPETPFNIASVAKPISAEDGPRVHLVDRGASAGGGIGWPGPLVWRA